MLAIVATAVLDQITGVGISVSVFYVLPIFALAAMRGGRGAAVATIACALAHLPVILLAHVPPRERPALYWNGGVELVLLLLLAASFVGWFERERRIAARAAQDRENLMTTIAHDLRNPLGAILLESSRMERTHDCSAEYLRARTERIGRAAARMDVLIRDLLDVAHAQGGHLDLVRHEHEVRMLVIPALEAMRPEAQARGVDLALDLEDAEVSVRCDGDRVVQALEHLLVNGIRSTPQGGVVCIGAHSSSDEVTFAVTGGGPAMNEADAQRAFDRFWHGARPHQGQVDLGLAITRAIVEAHGGAVRVVAAAGGASLTFTLPRGWRSSPSARRHL
jgi:signal transduction histidine kinase